MKAFRQLRADEIDCRISTIKPNGVTLLLYKDARCDMNILDETVGPMNWQRTHSRDNANCTITIWDEEKKQWVGKEDTGTESRKDADGNEKKGLASDSFKRAGFNWGIGRELYTAPFIWIKSTDCTIKDGKCFDRFFVNKIEYKNNAISYIEIVNEKINRVVYKMFIAEPADDFSLEYATELQKKTFMELCKNLNVDYRVILKQVGVTGKMTVEQHGKALIILKEIEESEVE